MPNIVDYLNERIDSESPGVVTVSPGNTMGIMVYIIDTKYLYECLKAILGYTTYDNRIFFAPEICPAGLRRVIPMSMAGDWTAPMYADKVEVQYFNPEGKLDPANNDILVNQFSQNNPQTVVTCKTFSYYGTYSKARLIVSFKTRNYFVLSDEQLDKAMYSVGNPVYKYTFYKKFYEKNFEGKNVLKSKPVNWFDYGEYLRNVEVDIQPNNDIVILENGSLFWKNKEGVTINGPTFDTMVGTMNSSAVFQNITKNIITMTWRQIPQSAIFTSQYAKYIGMINYGANFNEDAESPMYGYPLYNFTPGTLLYLGCSNINMRSPFPILPYRNETDVAAACSLIENCFVDLEFKFMQFDIPSEMLAQPKLVNIDLIKGKMYSNGFNFAFLPYNKAFYMESNTKENSDIAAPPYWSYDFRRLFCPQAID